MNPGKGAFIAVIFMLCFLGAVVVACNDVEKRGIIRGHEQVVNR